MINMMTKMKSVIIALILLSLSISGCMVGPDFEEPVMDLPDEFRFSTEDDKEAVNLKWWELFNDPVLNSLVTTALNENKDLLIAMSRVEEARAFLGFTKADIFPVVNLQGAASRGNFAGGMKVDEPGNIAFIAPVASWEIDFWGKFRRANESARAQLLASEFGKRTVQISLISEVVSTYFLLLDFHQRLKVSKKTLESRDESLDIIQKRYNKGIITELDLNWAQVQREIAAASIPANERLIHTTENALSILLGKFPEEIKTDLGLYEQTIPPDIPAGLPSTLLERRPDILEALYLLQAQNAQIGVAVALRFPALSLTGSLGAATSDVTGMTVEGFAWNVGAGLFAPVFTFGKNKSRVEIEEARTEQALYSYQNTVLNAFREVSDALTEIQTYRVQIVALEKQEKAAGNANILSNLRYDQGFSSFLEVLETERQLFAVELELSQVTQEYYNSYVRLYKALGGGWLSEEEMTQVQDQTPVE